MASDSSDPSRRKHHRSPSIDDSDEPSKRRKHRHHHHHRRHRHHHRSKKEKELKTEEISNEKDEARVDNVGTVEVVAGSNLGIDYEMEEGEIIDDDERIAVAGHDMDDFNTGARKGNLKDIENGLRKSGEDNLDGKESKKDGETNHDELQAKMSSVKHLENGQSVENGLPFEESKKGKNYYYEDSDVDNHRMHLSSENVGKKQKWRTPSPSRKTRDKGGNRSKSPHPSRGRSRSQSIFEESSLPRAAHRLGDEYYAERKRRSDSENERIFIDRKHRHGSVLRDRERERSSSFCPDRVDRHHSQETYKRDRAGSQEMDMERMREKDREREREKDKERDRERRREKVREREWERERERERDRQRDMERDRERERVRDRERRQRDTGSRGRSRNRDRDEDTGHQRYDETDHRERIRRGEREKVQSPRHSTLEKESEKLKRDEDEQEDYEEKITFQLAEQEEEDLDRIKEESRRRRQAILEKYRSQKSQQQQENQGEDTAEDHQLDRPSQPATAVNVVSETPDGQTEGADLYDADPSFAIGKSPQQNGLSVLDKASGNGGLGEGTPKSERSTDMFCDDIFGESPTGVRKKGKGDGLAIERSGLNDNWDDAEGYYSYRFGEILDGRYEIIAAHGKGVFSTVVRAKDLKAKPGDTEEVAIKMIRNNDTMYKAGMEELVILKKLAGADPENRRHCVRFISSFKYRNHLCLVFESLHMNLREVLKKFGRNIGLKLTAVRAYAKQLFIALKHLRNCGVLHCDIKPDNMLVNEAKNVLKLCDFGNAMFAGKNEITPYLVSRFYRAPEIILGLPYDHPLDIWSVGCCLFELYTGKVLFPGHTNNDMLRLHMELKGPFPKKMLRKGAFIDRHFDQNLNFFATEEDPVTKKAIKRLIINIKPKDIGTLMSGSPGEEPKMLANFKDLLEKIFMLDPDKRLTVSQALSHPFITGK